MLASLPFVQVPDVSLEKRGDLAGLIRGEVEFSEGGVTSAKQPSLEDVLDEIEGLISRDQE